MKGMSLHQTGVMVHGGKGIDPPKVAKGTLKDVLCLEAQFHFTSYNHHWTLTGSCS